MRPKFRVDAAIAAAVVICGAISSHSAFAQAAYKASDIVARFAPPPELGSSRALCVGTGSECAKTTAPPKQTGGFDLVVNFDYNSDNLTRPAKANLDEFATALKDPRLATSAFVVEGHTDGAGGEEYNLDLSLRRANAVVSYLKSRGVPQDKLEAKGYGKQRPIVSDPMSGANRRVETRLRAE